MKPQMVVFEDVVQVVADAWGVEPIEIMGRTRVRPIVDARSVACYLLRENGWTWMAIARPFGRDHSTIIAAHQRVRAAIRAKATAPRGLGSLSAWLDRTSVHVQRMAQQRQRMEAMA